MTTAGGPSSSSLADVIDTILDKGLVIDAYVRVSLVGIELLTIDARSVVASLDTYLRFAEAANRLAIGSEPKGLSDLVSDVKGSGARRLRHWRYPGDGRQYSGRGDCQRRCVWLSP